MLLDFFSDAWVQLIMWTIASFTLFFLGRLLKGSGGAWPFIAIGVFLIGIRVGYKILPFYNASEFSKTLRFIIGIIGITMLFIGLMKYYYNNLKPMLPKEGE